MDDATPPPGTARSPGQTWTDILDADSRQAPPHLRQDAYRYLGSDPIPTGRYTDPAFFAGEVARMWPYVWQYAARDEDLPEPGDYVVYENAGRSYLIIRQTDGGVRAFHNVCLHRGRLLRTHDGHAKQFKCPYHGFAWAPDGAFAGMPCRWDFPHLKDEAMSLPEAQVERWGGFIFLREEAGGPPLAEYLAPLPAHFADYRLEDTVTAVWVGKVIPANWKAAADAFIETWHVLGTHPQILSFTGDANSQYNIYSDHVTSSMTAFAVPSPHLDRTKITEQGIIDDFARFASRKGSEDIKLEAPEGVTARQALAEMSRARFAAMFGGDYSQTPEAELLDALLYGIFPNMAVWGGFMPNVVYRWRPAPDQDATLMDVRVLMRVRDGEPRPRGVRMKLLGPDEPWSAASELGAQGDVFDQDMANLPYVQQGMKASKTGLLQLGDYQEIRVRHLHRTLDKYLQASDL